MEKVAEIRRESGQINIYVEDKDGNYTKYIDHLATRIFEWKNMNKELAELYKEAEGLYSTPVSDHVDVKALAEEERAYFKALKEKEG